MKPLQVVPARSSKLGTYKTVLPLERIFKPLQVVAVPRKVDVRLPGKGNSKLPWRKAGPPNHLDEKVDSDQ